jgi:ATP-binding cassette subfamily C protein
MHMAHGLSAQATLSSFPRVLLETVFAIFILLFVAIAALGDHLNAETIALLGLFAYVVLRITPSLNRVSLAVNNLRFGGAALDTVVRDLHSSEEIQRRPAPGPGVTRLTQTIVVDNVSYQYPNHDETVLRDVSLTVRRGESIGLVGSTGAGKTTLVDVILGLLVPTRGRVLVDGRDIADCRADWQRSLGVVSQTVFLLDDSLRRNIAFGLSDDRIDDDKVTKAVEMAQLDEFITSLPDGLDTPVGERGVRLSGGQRQRVAIARALYRRPDVVVFDEGTSALDSLTEAEVMAAVDRLRGDRTLLMVAHRLTTVRRCDKIILLENGKISGIGTYDELLGQSDSFRRMALG